MAIVPFCRNRGVSMSAWVYMTMAILFEVAGTICLKLSFGLSKLFPSLLVGLFYLISFASLAFALKRLDVGAAYAIWSGLGTAIISIIGIAYLGEPMTLLKILSILLIIGGVAGLHLSGTTH